MLMRANCDCGCGNCLRDLCSTLPSQIGSVVKRASLNLISKLSYSSGTGMPGVPQGAFAAYKVREQYSKYLVLTEDETTNSEKMFNQSKSHKPVNNAMEQPMQYSSKLMNSIWGLYNRYSVHNFKKNTDGKLVLAGEYTLAGAIPQTSIPGFYRNP